MHVYSQDPWNRIGFLEIFEHYAFEIEEPQSKLGAFLPVLK